MWSKVAVPVFGEIRLEQIPRRVRLGAVIAALVLLCLMLGIAVARGSTILLLAVLAPPLLGLALVVSIRYFELLVLILPVSALALRFAELPTGSASMLPISLAIALGLTTLWVASMVTRREWQLQPSRINRPLLAFMAVCLISLPWGIIWADPVLRVSIMGNFRVTQIGSLASLIVSMCVPFLVARFIDKPWKIRFYIGSFIVCGTLMTATQLFGIPQFFLTDAGLWGLWYAVPIVGLLIVQPGIAQRWRIALGLLLAAHLFLVVIRNSLWISGWLPTMIGIVAVLFFHSRKLFLIGIVLALLFAAVGPGRTYLEQVTQDNVEEGGLERLEIWEIAFRVVRDHWFLGTGPAGYAVYYMNYWPTQARSTHNNYFDILAQFGVVGLTVWLWFMYAVLREGWVVIRRAPYGLLRTVAIIAVGGWVGAFASMMLGDWILPFAYNQGIGGFKYTVYSWLFLGLLLSVRRMTEPEPTTAIQVRPL